MSGRAVVVVVDGTSHRRIALVAEGLELLWCAAIDPSGLRSRHRDLEPAVNEALSLAELRGLDVIGLAFATSDPKITVDLIETFEQRYGLPTVAGRVADSILEGERLFGAVRGTADALIFDSDAPAVALQLGDRIHRGVHGLAGDIAHLGLDRTGPLRCRCGRHGCLGALVAAGDAAPEPPRPAACMAAPTHAIGWLAVAGVTLLNVVNPEVLVVSGALVDDSSHLAWFAEAVRVGCLDATRAGLREITAAKTNSVLTGTAALFATASFVVPE